MQTDDKLILFFILLIGWLFVDADHENYESSEDGAVYIKTTIKI